MTNRKTRRHSGRIYPRPTPKMKKAEIINKCLEPQVHWSDWADYRDSIRCPTDRTKLRRFSKGMRCLSGHRLDKIKYNKKIKKLIMLRRARRGKANLRVF